jgi:hypothetical protein
VQLGAGRAGQFGDPPLDRGVDVLVARYELEPSGRHLLFDRVESHQDPISFGTREQAGAREATDMGTRARDVVAPQPRSNGRLTV